MQNYTQSRHYLSRPASVSPKLAHAHTRTTTYTGTKIKTLTRRNLPQARSHSYNNQSSRRNTHNSRVRDAVQGATNSQTYTDSNTHPLRDLFLIVLIPAAVIGGIIFGLSTLSEATSAPVPASNPAFTTDTKSTAALPTVTAQPPTPTAARPLGIVIPVPTTASSDFNYGYGRQTGGSTSTPVTPLALAIARTPNATTKLNSISSAAAAATTGSTGSSSSSNNGNGSGSGNGNSTEGWPWWVIGLIVVLGAILAFYAFIQLSNMWLTLQIESRKRDEVRNADGTLEALVIKEGGHSFRYFVRTGKLYRFDKRSGQGSLVQDPNLLIKAQQAAQVAALGEEVNNTNSSEVGSGAAGAGAGPKQMQTGQASNIPSNNGSNNSSNTFPSGGVSRPTTNANPTIGSGPSPLTSQQALELTLNLADYQQPQPRPHQQQTQPYYQAQPYAQGIPATPGNTNNNYYSNGSNISGSRQPQPTPNNQQAPTKMQGFMLRPDLNPDVSLFSIITNHGSSELSSLILPLSSASDGGSGFGNYKVSQSQAQPQMGQGTLANSSRHQQTGLQPFSTTGSASEDEWEYHQPQQQDEAQAEEEEYL